MTTAGCHLCDQAFEMIRYLLDNDAETKIKVELEIKDIANDDVLIEQYGIRIPVVKCLSDELSWPFDLEELKTWLHKPY